MKQGNFRRICDIAVSYVSRLGFTDIAVSQLIMQMRSFKDGLYPYDFIFNVNDPITWWTTIEDNHNYLQQLAIKLFSIVPSQASCERTFSILKWIHGLNRNSLSSDNLESMAIIRSYLISDIEKTMFYVPKKNNDIDFSSVANSETVIDGLDLEEEESFTSLELEEDLSDVSDNNIDNNNLSIESIIDLSVLISGSDISAQDITSDITSPFAEGITDYNPHELVANLVTEDE
jgi:hypothetical protein